MATIEDVMFYQHAGLIQRLQEKLGIDEQAALLLFIDTKQFLFLCGTVKGRFAPPSESIDEAWHNFILYTEDYNAFCLKYFGHFVHHRPKHKDDQGSGDKLLLEKTVSEGKRLFGNQLSANWTNGLANCAGSTNCQDPDPDI